MVEGGGDKEEVGGLILKSDKLILIISISLPDGLHFGKFDPIG